MKTQPGRASRHALKRPQDAVPRQRRLIRFLRRKVVPVAVLWSAGYCAGRAAVWLLSWIWT